MLHVVHLFYQFYGFPISQLRLEKGSSFNISSPIAALSGNLCRSCIASIYNPAVINRKRNDDYARVIRILMLLFYPNDVIRRRRQSSFTLGASTYDVRSWWGEGCPQKADEKLSCDSDKGGGVKNLNILRTSYMEAPLRLSLPRPSPGSILLALPITSEEAKIERRKKECHPSYPISLHLCISLLLLLSQP